jgi:hypothetical protein
MSVVKSEAVSTSGANLKVPSSATWLGGLGVVPFLGLAAALPFLAGEPKSIIAYALVAYGATILSFLGGLMRR